MSQTVGKVPTVQHATSDYTDSILDSSCLLANMAFRRCRHRSPATWARSFIDSDVLDGQEQTNMGSLDRLR